MKAAKNMDEQISLQQTVESFGFMTKNIAGYLIKQFLAFKGPPHWFHVAVQVCTPSTMNKCFAIPTLMPILDYIYIFNFTFLTGERWTLKILLVFISLLAKNVEHFKVFSQPSVFHLLRPLYLVPIPIFKRFPLMFGSLYVLCVNPQLSCIAGKDFPLLWATPAVKWCHSLLYIIF